VLVEALNVDETNSLLPAGPARAWDQSLVDRHQAMVATEQGKDVME